MIYLLVFLAGCGIGSAWREIWTLKKLVAKLNKPEPKPSGVTMGSYSVPNKEQPASKNIVNPKSPQQVEFERQQKEFNQGLIERATHPYGDN